MMGNGILPNNFTFPFVLKVCANVAALKETRLIHGLIVKIGFESNVFVMNALLHAYSTGGSVWFASAVFAEMPERSVVSWNSMIDGYCRIGDSEKAYRLFVMMRELGLKPDGFALVSILSLSLQSGNLGFGRFVHWFVTVNGIEFDLILWNALLDMYGKCGELRMARLCFDRMPMKNVVSWTSLVCAHAKHGLIDLARVWFDRMPEKSIVSWNAMISCYIQHGLCRQGLELYSHMQNLRITPDENTLGNIVVGKQVMKHVLELETYNGGLYVLLSNMFYENQRWEDMKRLRKLMKERGIRKGKGRSSIEINGDVYEFMVEDTSHENSSYVHSTLDALTDHLMSLEWFCDLSVTSWQLEE
ncbi:uncharacterized protein A4U43_C07F23840 [Asparagus officinalis]|uniref:DYW domain-containing protein n=1 Tax=Asparagus officinalis TaxID=4686 RepID=A0A5P1EED6_ASPOF|nr:uncharacterized protein A4U43_C07F23840 [Asparagus officinalis]